MPARLGIDNTVRLNRGVDNLWDGSLNDTSNLHNIDGKLRVQQGPGSGAPDRAATKGGDAR